MKFISNPNAYVRLKTEEDIHRFYDWLDNYISDPVVSRTNALKYRNKTGIIIFGDTYYGNTVPKTDTFRVEIDLDELINNSEQIYYEIY